MIPLTVDELRALGLGRLEGEGVLHGVTTDSRRAGPGDLFVAVRRGREFLGPARAAGAATLDPDDAYGALAAIASLVRARSGARVVAITGSVGKTSTKDVLASLCAPVARTVAAEASFNNEVGLPLTVCRLEPDTEVLIVEMGMRGFGQITELCGIARPHVGVVTAIAPAHLELVGSVEGVARAKGELLLALPVGGTAVVPAGERLLEPYLRADLDVRRVALPGDAEVGGGEAVLPFAGRRIRFPLGSRHQAENALAALQAYDALGLPLDRAQEGAAAVRLSAWRGEELDLPGGGLAINDAYNANPASVRAALEHLRERAGGRRAVAVLGGMAELGDHAPRYHRELAAHAASLGIELLAVGELAGAYGAERWVPGPDEALEALAGLLRPGDVVLVKASRAVGLEGVAPALAKREAAWSAS